MHEPRENAIDYVELPSRDIPATQKFFTALLGWTFQDYGPDYIAFEDGRIAGGFFAATDAWPDASACPLVVFYSAELEMMRAEAVRLGAEMTRDIFAFPGGRRFHFRAPGSGEFAVWSDR
jgi:predicted enzyme related to lactoylglutathione lyase